MVCRFLEQYESMYVDASNDVPKYVNNPINAYLLIKRLSSDLKQVESVMEQHSITEQGINQIIIVFDQSINLAVIYVHIL